MKNYFKVLLIALLPSAAMADTITVSRAQFLGPLEVRTPYITESENCKATKAFLLYAVSFSKASPDLICKSEAPTLFTNWRLAFNKCLTS